MRNLSLVLDDRLDELVNLLVLSRVFAGVSELILDRFDRLMNLVRIKAQSVIHLPLNPAFKLGLC